MSRRNELVTCTTLGRGSQLPHRAHRPKARAVFCGYNWRAFRWAWRRLLGASLLLATTFAQPEATRGSIVEGDSARSGVHVGECPSEMPQRVSGDCTGDGLLDAADLRLIVSIAIGTLPLVQCELADLDLDGEVTVDEIIAVVAHTVRPPPTGTLAPATATETTTPTHGLVNTIAASPTNTVSPTQPSDEGDLPTPTPVGATASATPTPLSVPPTVTSTQSALPTGTNAMTATAVPPVGSPTPTPSFLGATVTATSTPPPLPPTFTGTQTASPTRTNTTVATAVPPTVTFTPTATPADRGQLYVSISPSGGTFEYLVVDAATGAERFRVAPNCTGCVPWVSDSLYFFSSTHHLHPYSRTTGVLQQLASIALPNYAPVGGAFIQNEEQILYTRTTIGTEVALYAFDPSYFAFSTAPLWTTNSQRSVQRIVPTGPVVHIVQGKVGMGSDRVLVSFRADTGGEFAIRDFDSPYLLLDATRGDNPSRPIVATYDYGSKVVSVSTTDVDGTPCILHEQSGTFEGRLARWQDWLYVAGNSRLIMFRVVGCDALLPAITVDMPPGSSRIELGANGDAFLAYSVPGDSLDQDWVAASTSPDLIDFSQCTPGLRIGSLVVEWRCPSRWVRRESSVASFMFWGPS